MFITPSHHEFTYIYLKTYILTHPCYINTQKCFHLTAHFIGQNADTTEQQLQLDENGEVITTIEGHELQPEEAEEIDNENAAIIHDDARWRNRHQRAIAK